MDVREQVALNMGPQDELVALKQEVSEPRADKEAGAFEKEARQLELTSLRAQLHAFGSTKRKVDQMR